jgi:hypothetical protein
LHKGVKLRQALKRAIDLQVFSHGQNIERTWSHFIRSGDLRLGLASLGAELAIRGDFAIEDVDYTNPRAAAECRLFENYSSRRIRRLVKWLRFRNRAYWPFLSRVDVLQYGAGAAYRRRFLPTRKDIQEVGVSRAIARRILPATTRRRLVQMLNGFRS